MFVLGIAFFPLSCNDRRTATLLKIYYDVVAEKEILHTYYRFSFYSTNTIVWLCSKVPSPVPTGQGERWHQNVAQPHSEKLYYQVHYAVYVKESDYYGESPFNSKRRNEQMKCPLRNPSWGQKKRAAESLRYLHLPGSSCLWLMLDVV